jgi:hypothetical protein
MRNLLPEEMMHFDFPDASETRGARDVTTVPTQSLFLLNSPFVVQLANTTAKLLLRDSERDESLSRRAYRRLYGREPSTDEVARLRHYAEERLEALEGNSSRKLPADDEDLQSGKASRAEERSPATPREVVWSEIVHAMFASAEFRYR